MNMFGSLDVTNSHGVQEWTCVETRYVGTASESLQRSKSGDMWWSYEALNLSQENWNTLETEPPVRKHYESTVSQESWRINMRRFSDNTSNNFKAILQQYNLVF